MKLPIKLKKNIVQATRSEPLIDLGDSYLVFPPNEEPFNVASIEAAVKLADELGLEGIKLEGARESVCEKCWADAYGGGYYGGCKSQTERYMQLLEERKDNPCQKEKKA